jgi:hypothetical protein
LAARLEDRSDREEQSRMARLVFAAFDVLISSHRYGMDAMVEPWHDDISEGMAAI